MPLSYTNNEIEEVLVKLGCQLLSAIKNECDRDTRGKLTHWRTGRRFVYISLPKEPLPREVKVGLFNAKLYHREQRAGLNKHHSQCWNCFETGHLSYECTNPTVCRTCKKPGHKQGDSTCDLVFESDLNSNPSSLEWPTVGSSIEPPATGRVANREVSQTGDQAAQQSETGSAEGSADEPARSTACVDKPEGVTTQAPAATPDKPADSKEDSSSKAGKGKDKKAKNKQKKQLGILQMLSKKRPPSPEDSLEEKKLRKDGESDNIEMSGNSESE